MIRFLALGLALVLAAGPALGQSQWPADRVLFDDADDLQEKFDAGDLGGGPGGSDTELQFNNGGLLGGASGATYADVADHEWVTATPDITLGDQVDEGILAIGTSYLGQADDSVGGLTMDDILILWNSANVVTDVSFMFVGGATNLPRFVIAEEGNDLATWNPRSLLVGPPASSLADATTGIQCSTSFDVIDCDSGASGADLGVQDDIELGGNLIHHGTQGDGFETTLSFTTPTADRTITVPDADVTLAGGSSPFNFCRSGTSAGFGLDAATGLYDFACANYNWSAEKGGVDTNADDGDIGVGEAIANYAKATTVGGNSELIVCSQEGKGVSGATGVSENEGSCLEDGELVRKNSMADLVLAMDHTQPGGKVYIPVLSGYTNTIYEINGAGCRNSSATPDDSDDQDCETSTTGGSPTMAANNAPVLRFPNDTFYAHRTSAIRRIEFVAEDRDNDGPWLPFQTAAASSVPKRSGVWFSLDVGNVKAGCTDYAGTSAAGTAADMCRFQFNLGGQFAANLCHDIDVDGVTKCDVEASAIAGVPSGMYGRTAIRALFGGTGSTRQTPALNWCLTNRVVASGGSASTGVCATDPRVICDTGSDACPADMGTCTGIADQITADNDRDVGGTVPIKIDVPGTSSVEDEFLNHYCTGAGAPNACCASAGAGSCSSGINTFWSLPNEGQPNYGTTCGANNYCTASGTPLPCCSGSGAGTCNSAGKVVTLGGGMGDANAAFTTQLSSSRGVELVSPVHGDAFFNEGGGFRGFNIMTESWDGRDSAVDIFDCNADTSADNDENQCDSAGIAISMNDSFHGAFTHTECWHCDSGDGFIVDGSGRPIDAKVIDFKIENKASGIGCIDVGGRYEGIIIQNSTNCSINMFSAPGIYKSIVIENSANANIKFLNSRSVFVEDVRLRGNKGVAFVFQNAGIVTVRNVHATSNDGSIVIFQPAANAEIFGVTLAGFRLDGFQNWNRQLGVHASAPIQIGNMEQGAAVTGDIRSIDIVDWEMIVPGKNSTGRDPDVCLVYIDDNAIGGLEYMDSLQEITVRDSSIIVADGNGTETVRLICIDDYDDTGHSYASTDQFIWAKDNPPVMLRNSINAVALPDQPYRTVTADPPVGCGDCTATPAAAADVGTGATCRINKDTAVGACTDAGADGVLDGGGTAVSVCVCEAGTWTTLY